MSTEHPEYFTVEEHPWPPVIMHWLHLISFLTLAVTGYIIHKPPQGIDMQVVRTLHFFFMFVFVLTFITRVYWAFAGAGSANTGGTQRVRDWRHFTNWAGNFGLLWEYIKYYLFLRKDRPEVPKYNPLQSMTYAVLFPLGTIWMAITGFTIWTNTGAYMQWAANLVGGLDNMRMLHYFGMWVMLVFWMIHLYLTIFEEPAQLGVMLLRWVPEKHRRPAEDKAA